jgi:hypothetical protein
MNYVYEKNSEVLFITNSTEGATQDPGVTIHEVEEIPENPQIFDMVGGAFVINQAKSSAFDAWEAEHLAFVAQEEANIAAKAYLADTDWLAIREAETSTPIPDAIRTKRVEARESVIILSEAYQDLP